MYQEKIIDELGTEMDSTATRLDFVQVIIFPLWLIAMISLNCFIW